MFTRTLANFINVPAADPADNSEPETFDAAPAVCSNLVAQHWALTRRFFSTGLRTSTIWCRGDCAHLTNYISTQLEGGARDALPRIPSAGHETRLSRQLGQVRQKRHSKSTGVFRRDESRKRQEWPATCGLGFVLSRVAQLTSKGLVP